MNSFRYTFLHISLSLLLSLLFTKTGDAATRKISELKSRISTSSKPEQLKLLLELCAERNSMPADSLKLYVQRASDINSEINDIESAFLIEYYTAAYLQHNNPDSSELICNRNINKLTDDKYSSLKLKFMSLKGALLLRNTRYKESISIFYDVMKEAERTHDTLHLMAGRTCIGWAYMELAKYPESVTWLKRAIETSDNFNYYRLYPISNLAAVFNSLHKNDSALILIDQAIGYAIEAEDLKAQANGYAIRSSILIEQLKYEEAEEMLVKMLETRYRIGDLYYTISDMYQLGMFYARTKQCEKGKKICEEAIQLAVDRNLAGRFVILYEALAENYKSCDDKSGYATVLEKLITLKDSVYKKNSAEALAEMQTKYDVEKKEKIIIQQEYSLNRRNYLIYGSVILFALTGVIGYQYFSQYRRKQQLLEHQAVIRAKENERKRIAAELHDNIGAQLSYISRKIEVITTNTSGLSEDQLKNLIDINNSAGKTIEDLRETIWTLKKEKISMQDLADRMKSFVQHQLSDHSAFNLNIEENISYERSFSSVESLNLFRIFQEAIHNVIRHSEATEIKLGFISNSMNWEISVKDNGKGFHVSGSFEGHFGLDNMKERASEIRAILEITSNPGEGTYIRITNDVSNNTNALLLS